MRRRRPLSTDNRTPQPTGHGSILSSRPSRTCRRRPGAATGSTGQARSCPGRGGDETPSPRRRGRAVVDDRVAAPTAVADAVGRAHREGAAVDAGTEPAAGEAPAREELVEVRPRTGRRRTSAGRRVRVAKRPAARNVARDAGHVLTHHPGVDRDLPSGTVSFLFTDVEGSTRLLHELGPADYAAALANHRRVLRNAFSAHGGVEVDTQGDAFFVAFPTAPGALAAADEARRGLVGGSIRVRVGIHTGSPLLTEEGYVGVDVHRAARIAACGHGGQVLVSASTAALLPRRTCATWACTG